MSNPILHNGNDNDNIYKDPVRFIDTLNYYKHIILYYENQEFGKKIQFRFIKNGLLKGENCGYITIENDMALIVNDMMNNDINVKNFVKKGLLKICKILDVIKHPIDVIEGSEEIIDRMLTDLNPPFRLVVKLIDKLNTNEQIKANLSYEQKYHINFDKFNGLVLCTYDASKNPVCTDGKWVETILNNHHSSIFITDAVGEGIAFDTI